MGELLAMIREFNEARDWGKFHTPKNLAMALMVEAAELAEHFQWLTGEESCNLSQDKREKVADEIADVLIYLLNLSDRLAIDPVAAARAKIGKNGERYPAEKVAGKALKYSDYE